MCGGEWKGVPGRGIAGPKRAYFYCAWLHQANLERSRERSSPEGAAGVRRGKLGPPSIQPRAQGGGCLGDDVEAILDTQVKAVLRE